MEKVVRNENGPENAKKKSSFYKKNSIVSKQFDGFLKTKRGLK